MKITTEQLTKEEVLQKLDNYKTSTAPAEVKEQAIAKLLKQYSYYFTNHNEVIKGIAESQADLDDIN